MTNEEQELTRTREALTIEFTEEELEYIRKNRIIQLKAAAYDLFTMGYITEWRLKRILKKIEKEKDND